MATPIIDIPQVLSPLATPFAPGTMGAGQTIDLYTSGDMSPQINAAIAALAAGAGGTIRLSAGTGHCSQQILTPTFATGPLRQRSIRILGAGAGHNGDVAMNDVAQIPSGGTILDMPYSGGAKIASYGNGRLEIAGISFIDTMDGTQDFVHIRLTTLFAHDNLFYGKTVRTSGQDVFRLGEIGQMFLGFKTVIRDNWFCAIRRGLYGTAYTNGVAFVHNNFGVGCGGHAAVTLDGTGPAFCVGNEISGNLIEMEDYRIGVEFLNNSYNNVADKNSFFDPTAKTKFFYYSDATSSQNTLVENYSDGTLFGIPFNGGPGASGNIVISPNPSIGSSFPTPVDISLCSLTAAAGTVNIQTVQMPTFAAATSGQTIICPDGLEFVWQKTAGFTPTGGDAYDIDVHTLSPSGTAEQMAQAFIAAIPTGPTGGTLITPAWTATSNGSGLVTITAKTAGTYDAVAVTGTGIGTVTNTQAGADGVALNLLYYNNSGSAALAKADAVTTARNLVGVSKYRASGVAAHFCQGPQRIKAESGCAPVFGAPAYLSATTAGNVASALTGTMYPVCVGVFRESAVAGDGTVLVHSDLNDVRDDETEWVISDDTVGSGVGAYPSTPPTTISTAVTRALWRQIKFSARLAMDAGAAINFDVASATNGVNIQTLSNVTPVSGQVAASNTGIFGTGAGGSSAEATETWVSGTTWTGRLDCWSGIGVLANLRSQIALYLGTSVPNSISFVAARAIWIAGCRVECKGKRRTS